MLNFILLRGPGDVSVIHILQPVNLSVEVTYALAQPQNLGLRQESLGDVLWPVLHSG